MEPPTAHRSRAPSALRVVAGLGVGLPLLIALAGEVAADDDLDAALGRFRDTDFTAGVDRDDGTRVADARRILEGWFRPRMTAGGEPGRIVLSDDGDELIGWLDVIGLLGAPTVAYEVPIDSAAGSRNVHGAQLLEAISSSFASWSPSWVLSYDLGTSSLGVHKLYFRFEAGRLELAAIHLSTR